MRTTINIDDQLLRQYKELAARAGKTLANVIEDALREVACGRKSVPEARPWKLLTVRGRGLLPGVSIDCTSALLEQIEGPFARP